MSQFALLDRRTGMKIADIGLAGALTPSAASAADATNALTTEL